MKSRDLESLLKTVVLQGQKSLENFHWEDAHCYGRWLMQTYSMVKYTTRFASLVAGALAFEDEEIHQNLLGHLREENHHEKLATKDLKELGFTTETFEVALQTKLLVQSQFYFISQSPLSHFGFVIFLEYLGATKGPDLAKRLKRAYGSKALNFIAAHADLDQGHATAIHTLVTELCKRPSVRSHLLENLEQSCLLYGQMLHQISENSSLQKAA